MLIICEWLSVDKEIVSVVVDFKVTKIIGVEMWVLIPGV